VRFQDRVVLVAGGTGALGRAVVMGFLAEGARVAVTSRVAAEVEALGRQAGGAGERVRGLLGDVTDPSTVDRLAAQLVAVEGRIDVMVNAVGGWAGGQRLWEAEPNQYPSMLAMNLTAGYALARAVVPYMLRVGRGAIVEVASKAALDPSPGAASYAASKAAALALFTSLAMEVKDEGVRVNVIVPSVFDTAANRKAMPGADYARWPSPEELAKVVLFLCSDDASAIIGASIPVYGRSV
jgi:NAD(P)-dependent dehydrogenase (short-subunit alcohol dehydrogenase family)